MTTLDFIALALFFFLWTTFSWVTSGKRFLQRTSLTRAMIEKRREWMTNALKRDLRMIDTQILAGLQNGTAFFASTSIFAIGGCFALLGATQQVEAVFKDLSFVTYAGRGAFELKVVGLTALFGYSFFKFGWSYRLFNYCTILFGGLPMTKDAEADMEAAQRRVERVVQMNIIAAGHFNAGLRALFLSIGYLGWFIGPTMFMASTVFIIVILIRRQFFSRARLAILD
ncbi:DUF599 domain-containing protein [Allorhizobium borbori]|uniref:Putative membrane protein n=1 Tax=Allorhizobium borbori TaxID=485907 RepID=A0A7W6JZN4_9HYPH|nr:DUF599 family protein [Allorhizobium borbori]MBB4102476.1 putative membrane protein [Allorhizobium borbori]PZU22687.1 MAG: DUF599 domain-containing protein [Shinella sp.]